MIRAVAALVMATVAWPAFRAVSSRALWRASPHLAVKLLVAVSVGSAVAIAIAVLAPLPVVIAVAVVAALVTAGDAWTRRPGRGVAAGLPPGSLGLLPIGPWRNQEFYAAQARRYGSVFKARQIVRPLACINDLPTGRALLKEADADLVAPPLGFSRFIPGGYLRYRAPAEHASYKSLFRTAFSRDVADARSAHLHAGFRDGLSAVAVEGAAVPPRARVNRILFPAWAGLYAGFEPDAPETARLKEALAGDRHAQSARGFPIVASGLRLQRWARSSSHSGHGSTRCRTMGCRAASSTRFAVTTRQPSTTPPCSAISSSSSTSRGAMSRACSPGSRGCSPTILRSSSRRAPSWPRRMRLTAPRRATVSATRIVLETLRLEQSEHIYRRTTSSVTVADRTIPAGWIVRVGVHEAHRNPTVFERPDTFDPDRFLGRSYAKDEFSPFGAHRLACLGEQVTLAVARTFTEELVTGFDLETTRDGPAELGSWGHWAPSSRWRLALIPVAGGAAS